MNSFKAINEVLESPVIKFAGAITLGTFMGNMPAPLPKCVQECL